MRILGPSVRRSVMATDLGNNRPKELSILAALFIFELDSAVSFLGVFQPSVPPTNRGGMSRKADIRRRNRTPGFHSEPLIGEGRVHPFWFCV
jgi:hypothetical protein